MPNLRRGLHAQRTLSLALAIPLKVILNNFMIHICTLLKNRFDWRVNLGGPITSSHACNCLNGWRRYSAHYLVPGRLFTTNSKRVMRRKWIKIACWKLQYLLKLSKNCSWWTVLNALNATQPESDPQNWSEYTEVQCHSHHHCKACKQLGSSCLYSIANNSLQWRPTGWL